MEENESYLNPFNPLEKLTHQEVKANLHILMLLRKRKRYMASINDPSDEDFLQITDHNNIIAGIVIKKQKTNKKKNNK